MEGDFGRLTRSLRNYESRLYSRISGSVNLEFALWCLLKRCLASNSEVPAEIPPSPPLGKGGTTTKGGVDGYYEREGGRSPLPGNRLVLQGTFPSFIEGAAGDFAIEQTQQILLRLRGEHQDLDPAVGTMGWIFRLGQGPVGHRRHLQDAGTGRAADFENLTGHQCPVAGEFPVAIPGAVVRHRIRVAGNH